jgi:enolase
MHFPKHKKQDMAQLFLPVQVKPKTNIVHLALGLNAGQLKVGSMTRSERTSKWNEAIRLEDSNALEYFGVTALDHK